LLKLLTDVERIRNKYKNFINGKFLESISLELLFIALDRFDAFVNVKDALLVTDVAAKQLIMKEIYELVT